VRRCLHTLVKLGYAAQTGQSYVLRPKALALGYAYLSSSSLALRAQPTLDALRDEIHESCSLGVAEEDDVYYVARAETTRIMSVALRPGSRLPLYCTSMGRVLLAAMPRSKQEAYLERTALVARTERTQTDRAALLAILADVAKQGFAIVDQELELSLRSIAVPIRQRGDVVAALNVGAHADRLPLVELRAKILPALRRVASDLGTAGFFG
jgi:IclR family pca regulon transcriptional regulator